jgi:hypothetical protein
MAKIGGLSPSIVVLLACAGCTRKPDPFPEPVAPEPEKATLSITTHLYRSVPTEAASLDDLEPSVEINLRLDPTGEFLYSWRERPTGDWNEISGTWKRALGNEWTLIPDDPDGTLDPEDYPDGQFPTLTWGQMARLGDGQRVPKTALCYFVVPSVNVKTRRLTKNVAFEPDQRSKRFLDRFARSGRSD